MKRRGCVECHTIEPTPGQWRDGLCPRCTESRDANAAKAPEPTPPPAPPNDPALASTAARLLGYLKRIAEQYPAIWKNIDALRAERGRTLPQWPGWCFMPLAGAYAIMSGGRDDAPPERMADVGVIGALASWRPTQGVYRFDPTVADAVWETPLEGDIPTDILHHLPEWCVYVETPGRMYLDLESQGFFAWLEIDANDKREELRMAIDCSPRISVPLAVHLNHGGLVQGLEFAKREAMRQAEEFSKRPAGDVFAGMGATAERIMSVPSGMLAGELAPRISLLLYLCSTNAEMRERVTGKLRPQRPSLTKTKDGMRMFPAEKTATWEIAYRLGAAIRHAQEAQYRKPGDGTHASPRPHIRRAHWHSFWIGPKAKPGIARTEDRKLILKWIPPVPVNVEEEAEVVPTLHPVRR